MPAIVRTFTTRIENHPALTARAELESRIERKLYAALRSGREFKGDLAIPFYQQFGISAKTLDGIHRQLPRMPAVLDGEHATSFFRTSRFDFLTDVPTFLTAFSPKRPNARSSWLHS